MSGNVRECRKDLSDKEVYFHLVKRAELELRQQYPAVRNVIITITILATLGKALLEAIQVADLEGRVKAQRNASAIQTNEL